MLENFIASRYSLLFIFFVTLIFSFWSPFFSFSPEGVRDALIGTPKYWFDEASTMDAARAVAEVGELDIVVTPHTVSGAPYYANSPGFPVQLPLALIFKVFGTGLFQMRVYALLWLLATVVIIYVVVRDFFGSESAFWSTILVATFTSFYANGRTIVGTLPAFLFLLLALKAFYVRNSYAWGGMWAALAVVSKPSMFLFIIPAFAFEFIMNERRLFWSHAGRVLLGAIPAITMWFIVMFPQPFSSSMWQDVFSIYTNHYREPSLLSSLGQQWKNFLLNSTTIYFLGLLLVFLFVRIRYKITELPQHRFFDFVLMYAPFGILYFLMSPGWFRYLLVFELFMLISLYPLLLRVFQQRSIWITRGSVFGLILVQSIVFLFFSEIRSDLSIPKLATYLNHKLEEEPQSMIGIVNAEELGALIPSDRKYQIVYCGGDCRFGVHPLLVPREELPTYIVVNRRQMDKITPYQDILQEHYNLVPEEKEGFYIFQKIKN